MSDRAPFQEAAALVISAAELYRQGDRDLALTQMRQAVLLFASEPAADSDQIRIRANACRLYGDCLTEQEAYAEAAGVYQEAADLYARLGTPEGEGEAQSCARKILEVVAALRTRPRERLYLLIARYERQRQQFALQPGTEREQAEIVAHIALIFQRRDRHHDAISRYREALQLYARAEPEPDVLLACAECHHRIAGMLDRYMNDLPAAAQHYREAIALYAANEPLVHGRQAGHDLCIRALREIEHAQQ